MKTPAPVDLVGGAGEMNSAATRALLAGARSGAPRPTKMGTIASPWRNDAGACHAPQSSKL